jgi:hypothetical protein
MFGQERGLFIWEVVRYPARVESLGPFEQSLTCCSGFDEVVRCWGRNIEKSEGYEGIGR